MKKKINNLGVHKGYSFGDVSVHNHVDDPDTWFVTVRSMGLFTERLCPKLYSEAQIVESLKLLIEKLRSNHDKILNQIDKER